MKYRMYVDETGNSDLRSSDNPLHRYLGLTGIIIELEEAKNVLTPELEKLKRKHFSIEYDEPIILHRKEIINKKPPFNVLNQPEIEVKFNNDILSIMDNTRYSVITVVIDKLEHLQKYTTWRYEPYHYCLANLIERFVKYLENRDSRGDVLAESRGGRDDMRLKKAFAYLYNNGTDYVSSERFQSKLTSRQLKVKPKYANIAALQLADLVAHPSRQEVLSIGNKIEYNPKNFGNKIIQILNESKYDRSLSGKIDGYGRKLLP